MNQDTHTLRMPSLARGFYGFHHTVDSSLEVLAGLGISPSRITVRMAGLGWPDRWVVRQRPLPGTPLTGDLEVTLDVAGLGFLQNLPVGMWDTGGEAEPGTREIVQVFDDPLQKAFHWVRAGARLFDLSPENTRASARWISLFGLSPEHWPTSNWYHLALALPNLHRLAGREDGMRLAFQLLLGLPIRSFHKRPGWRYLPDEDLSLLGDHFGRLGVDFVLGERMEALAHQTILVGPVSLNTYYDYQQEQQKRLVRTVCDLCAPCHQNFRVRWLVLDPERAPRLGFEEQNARLGINSHVGAPAPVSELQPA